jgi:hypothetical protein
MALLTLNWDASEGYLRRSLSRSGRLGAGGVTVILLLAAVTAAWAQTPDEARPSQPDLTELSLPDLMKVHVEDVYGASKYRQKVTKAPSSVTIVTSDRSNRLSCSVGVRERF